MIRTEQLTKRYGSFTAVAGIDLNIPAGEIYGFLGPNGAGKTSTIMMLLGVVKPTAGEIRLFGEPYSPARLDLRRRIGVVPEKHPAGMWSWMTAGEYLQMFAELFRVPQADRRIDHLLERVGLAQVKRKKFAQFSRGMLQKLSIVRALLHDPDILFLDEPISGLDPFGVKQIRDLILEESREGRTIFVSSHLLSEMEKVCASGWRSSSAAGCWPKTAWGTSCPRSPRTARFTSSWSRCRPICRPRWRRSTSRARRRGAATPWWSRWPRPATAGARSAST